MWLKQITPLKYVFCQADLAIGSVIYALVLDSQGGAVETVSNVTVTTLPISYKATNLFACANASDTGYSQTAENANVQNRANTYIGIVSYQSHIIGKVGVVEWFSVGI